MADLCKQCSIEIFGEDYGDLVNLGGRDHILEPGSGYPAICEGCGFVRVDKEGNCLGDDGCLRKHTPPTI